MAVLLFQLHFLHLFHAITVVHTFIYFPPTETKHVAYCVYATIIIDVMYISNEHITAIHISGPNMHIEYAFVFVIRSQAVHNVAPYETHNHLCLACYYKWPSYSIIA